MLSSLFADVPILTTNAFQNAVFEKFFAQLNFSELLTDGSNEVRIAARKLFWAADTAGIKMEYVSCLSFFLSFTPIYSHSLTLSFHANTISTLNKTNSFLTLSTMTTQSNARTVFHLCKYFEMNHLFLLSNYLSILIFKMSKPPQNNS